MNPAAGETPYFFGIDDDDLLAVAAQHREAYAKAQPFPHAVIDDLLPKDAAEEILGLFPEPKSFEHLDGEPIASNPHQPGKQGLRHARNLRAMPQALGDVLARFNSSLWIRFVETLTGIEGLLPDPHLRGGGVHLIRDGGHLDVHLDYNVDFHTGLHRRVNVLLYLNHDWRPEFGGQLELWDARTDQAAHTIEPTFNRCVVFDISDKAWHGHPHALRLPPGRARKSLAFYYYTAGRPPGYRGSHGTIWRGKRAPSSLFGNLKDWFRSR